MPTARRGRGGRAGQARVAAATLTREEPGLLNPIFRSQPAGLRQWQGIWGGGTLGRIADAGGREQA